MGSDVQYKLDNINLKNFLLQTIRCEIEWLWEDGVGPKKNFNYSILCEIKILKCTF